MGKSSATTSPSRQVPVRQQSPSRSRWTHLYMGSELTKRVGDAVLHLTMESAFPWEGRAKMTVRADAPVAWTVPPTPPVM